MRIKSKQICAVLLATAALVACSSNADNSAANGQAADQSASNAAMTASTANPFADAEAKMNQAMMAAVGTDAGDTWAKKMIAHHQGAIDMSEAVLKQNPKPDVAAMAREGIDKQKKDIASIQKLLKSGTPDQKSADLYQASMMDMKQKMDAATGADINELFMRKMLEHHKGAVAMSDIALKNGVSGALKAQIEKTRAENQKDAEMTEAMLSGKPMSHAKARADDAGSTASHDMNAMGNMDMNRM